MKQEISPSNYSPLLLANAAARQIQDDSTESWGRLHRRDRTIAIDRSLEAAPPSIQMLNWVAELQGEKLERLMKQLNVMYLLFSILGLLFGFLTAAAVLSYDGAQPVNVLSVILVLLAGPLCLLLTSLFVMMPSRLLFSLPGVSAIAHFFLLFSPARLAPLLAKFLPADTRQQIEELLGNVQGQFTQLHQANKWSMFFVGQIVGLTFALAVLLYFVFAIAVSDIAFAWTTTLKIEAADIYSITSAISLPWRELFPDAVPSLELITNSRYFRFDGGRGLEEIQAAQLGDWWPFLVLAVSVYLLLPRLLLFFFTLSKRNSVCKRMLVTLPGTEDVRIRMSEELVSTQADVGEANSSAFDDSSQGGNLLEATKPLQLSAHATVVLWAFNDLSLDQVKGFFENGYPDSEIQCFRAGGAVDVSDERSLVTSLGKNLNNGSLVIVARAWEPPIAELFDFVGELLEQGSQNTAIYLLPVDADFPVTVTAVDAEQLAIWQRSLNRVGNPYLSLRRLDLGEARAE